MSAYGALVFTCDEFSGVDPCKTMSYLGTSSTDPDNDITSWSIEFGDGMSTGLITGPLAEVTHTYSSLPDIVVTLTVTDSAGQSDSDTDTLRVVSIFLTQD